LPLRRFGVRGGFSREPKSGSSRMRRRSIQQVRQPSACAMRMSWNWLWPTWSVSLWPMPRATSSSFIRTK
jgi:hypothetical protein